jgi:hypothetical protein
MRRRRKTDEIAEVVIVTTDDGKTFRGSIVATGHETEPRWALMDEHATQFLGPPVLADHSPEAIQRQITDWWAERNAKKEPEHNGDGAQATGDGRRATARSQHAAHDTPQSD